MQEQRLPSSKFSVCAKQHIPAPAKLARGYVVQYFTHFVKSLVSATKTSTIGKSCILLRNYSAPLHG